MKIIEVDDQLYQYIASKTENIGEQASDILRRLLGFEPLSTPTVDVNSASGRADAANADTAASTSSDEMPVVANDPSAVAPADEVIEMVIPASVQAENSTNTPVSDDLPVNDIADNESKSNDDNANDDSSSQLSQQSASDTEQSVQTTTVKKQSAKHQQLGQDKQQQDQQHKAGTETKDKSQVEPPAQSKSDLKPESNDQSDQNDKVAKAQNIAAAKTKTKAKAKRKPRAKTGPTVAQLKAKVGQLKMTKIT